MKLIKNTSASLMVSLLEKHSRVVSCAEGQRKKLKKFSTYFLTCFFLFQSMPFSANVPLFVIPLLCKIALSTLQLTFSTKVFNNFNLV